MSYYIGEDFWTFYWISSTHTLLIKRRQEKNGLCMLSSYVILGQIKILSCQPCIFKSFNYSQYTEKCFLQMHLYPSLEKPPPGMDLNYKVKGINEHRVKFKKKTVTQSFPQILFCYEFWKWDSGFSWSLPLIIYDCWRKLKFREHRHIFDLMI